MPKGYGFLFYILLNICGVFKYWEPENRFMEVIVTFREGGNEELQKLFEFSAMSLGNFSVC